MSTHRPAPRNGHERSQLAMTNLLADTHTLERDAARATYRGRAPRGPLPGARVHHGYFAEIPVMSQPEFAAVSAAFEEPYVGITTDGTLVAGLFSGPGAGAPTDAIAAAATEFLDSLDQPDQRRFAQQPFDSPHRRRWINAFYHWMPPGLYLDDAGERQREAAMRVVQASMSPQGFAEVRATMRSNQVLGDFINYWKDTLREYAYVFTIFGEPSTETPWMWQLMGHHVDLHCTIVGDRISLTPQFLATEMAEVDHGPDAGTKLFAEQEQRALAFAATLTPAQRETAVLYPSMLSKDLPEELGRPTNGRHRAGAGQDNLVLALEGLRASELSGEQREALLALLDVYLGRWPDGHRERERELVVEHLDETYFAWIGDTRSAPFYYKLHSPVILIEFDHHPGIFLDNDEPEPFHVHTIVRTPNGGDYGFGLLQRP
jgi:hypothetical protein